MKKAKHSKIKKNPNPTFSDLIQKAVKELTHQPLTQQQANEIMCQFFDNLIALLPVNIYWGDQEGHFLGCNERVAETFGFSSPEEIRGKTQFDFHPTQPEVAQKLLENDRLVMENNQPLTIEETGFDFAGEVTVYLTHKIPIKNNKDKVMGLLGISFDIAERKKLNDSLVKKNQQYQQQIRENKLELAKLYQQITGQPTDTSQSLLFYVANIRDYLEKIIAEMPGTVYWTDKNGKYLGCNDNVVKLFGLKSKDEFIGKTLYEFTDRELADATKKNDQEVMRTGKMMYYEENGLDPEGNPAIYLTYKVPLFSEKNEATGILGISIDITERKAMEKKLTVAKEEAEIANKTKSEFIRNMSHDLRTPLAGIIGALNVLKEQKIEKELQAFVESSYDAASALLSTFNSILEASKIEFGQEPELKENFSLINLINEVKNLYAQVVLEKNLYLKIVFAKKFPPYVFGYRRLLHRVLLNLVGNAIKFTNKGGIAIEIKIIKIVKKNITFLLSIKDTGIGIPKEKLQEIFLPFNRLTSSYKNSIEGSGLGLHIVEQYVEKLGGEIKVQSKIDKGSVFSIIISMEIGSEVKDKINNLEQNFILPQKNVHLLLVEDNLFIQSITKANLEHWGYVVDVANEGNEAIKKCKHTQYDLIYMDMGLPNNLDGCQTTSLIKKNTINKLTSVIALTAHADKSIIQDCLKVGVKFVVEKPLTKQKADEVYQNYLLNKNEKEIIEKNSNLIANDISEKTMLELFMDQLPAEKVKLQEAIQKQDVMQLRELLHSLIGALSYCDTPVLLAMAKKLHEVSKTNDFEKIKTCFKEFEKLLVGTIKNI